MSKVLNFPENFLWGAATSSYQVEGGLDNCDWAQEFPAGKACDHYHKFKEDFDLLEELNLDAYRFSIAWSRVEPEPGEFDQEEIEHYRKVLEDLKSRNIKTIATLHHFTTPVWMTKKGGWVNSEIAERFVRYSDKMFEEYKDLVDYWVTINEPLVYVGESYLVGEWPPRRRNPFLALKVIWNQVKAHRETYEVIKEKDPNSEAGIVTNNAYFEADHWWDKPMTNLMRYFNNDWFLNRVKDQTDFIGLNYYFHNKVKFPFRIDSDNKTTTDLGWEIYPEGIYHVLKDLKKYDKPIFITENGLADAEDELRKGFIKDHLRWVYKAMEEGVDVEGYFHWSLMDNFEWADGYEPRFGLVEVNYDTLERKIRPSARYYAQIAKSNKLET